MPSFLRTRLGVYVWDEDLDDEPWIAELGADVNIEPYKRMTGVNACVRFAGGELYFRGCTGADCYQVMQRDLGGWQLVMLCDGVVLDTLWMSAGDERPLLAILRAMGDVEFVEDLEEDVWRVSLSLL